MQNKWMILDGIHDSTPRQNYQAQFHIQNIIYHGTNLDNNFCFITFARCTPRDSNLIVDETAN